MCPGRSGSSVGSSARPMTRRVRGNSSSGGRPVLRQNDSGDTGLPLMRAETREEKI